MNAMLKKMFIYFLSILMKRQNRRSENSYMGNYTDHHRLGPVMLYALHAYIFALQSNNIPKDRTGLFSELKYRQGFSKICLINLIYEKKTYKCILYK